MSTFRGVFTCESCGAERSAHAIDEGEDIFATLTCPERPVSQPLSRVVAGPSDAHLDGCPGCFVCIDEQDRGATSAPACSLIADVAAFSALSPEQRAALLQIGADAVALLDAARATVGAPNLKVAREQGRVLVAFLARIDARRS